MKSVQANVVETVHDREPASGFFAGFDVAAAPADRQPPVKRLSRHEMLFSEGDSGGKYYEVLEGVVCSFRVLHDGRRQILSFSYPGDIVGIGHELECKCSCEAVSSARVRSIPAAALARSLDERPDLARKLFSVATSELASMHDHFVMVGRKSATEKLASFLLALARREVGAEAKIATFQLPMTRTDIADFLGLTIETVSRRFTALRKLGVIDLPQTTMVHVNDLRRLEELADGDDEIW
jgi:CRP/FNR family transcriptional regulator